MGKLIVKTTKLQDARLITPAVFGDQRGFFTETYSDRDFKAAGIDFNFIQDNQSLSSQAGVLRGLHFQRGQAAQTKLIRVVTGAVLDVIVDGAGWVTNVQAMGRLFADCQQSPSIISPSWFCARFLDVNRQREFSL